MIYKQKVPALGKKYVYMIHYNYEIFTLHGISSILTMLTILYLICKKIHTKRIYLHLYLIVHQEDFRSDLH